MAAAAVIMHRRRKEAERQEEEEEEEEEGLEDVLYGADANANGGKRTEEQLREDGHREDTEILLKLTHKVRESEARKRNYAALGGFVAFVALYMAVLYLQQQAFRTYQVASAHRQLLPPDTFSFSDPSAIYDWINETIIDTVYQDPDCGDGVCAYPEEFPGFGRFGCKADCGAMQNVTAVTVRFHTVFETSDDQQASSWNLCLTRPAFLCWYDEPKGFSSPLVNSYEEAFLIPDGSWDVVITAPRGGVEGQIDMVKSLNASAGGNRFLNETLVLQSWDNCKPRNESRLEVCRQTCASFAVCTALACDNIGQHDMANIAGDCYNVCTDDADGIINAYANATCYDVACALNDTSSFLSVYKDFPYCHPDPQYDGRSSFNGLQGLTWDSKDLSGFTGAPKPAHSGYCQPSSGSHGRKLMSARRQIPQRPRSSASWRRTKSAADASRRDLGLGVARRKATWRAQVAPDVDARRALAAASPPAPVSSLDAPPDSAPWLSLGPNDRERMQVLQVALARSLYEWPKRPCTCPAKYYKDPAATGEHLVALVCAYLGGPPALPRCNYTDPATGRQLSTLRELNAALKYIHQTKLGLVFAQDEQDAFLNVLVSNIAATANLPEQLLWAVSNRLHQSDDVLVNREWPPSCNAPDISLSWHMGVDIETTMYAGNTIEWVWDDDEPHSIRELKLGKGPFANYKGVGSGKLLLSRTVECAADNSGFINVTQLPPVPCATPDVLAGSSSGQNTFSYAWEFNTPGTFRYEDGQFGSLMTGKVNVLPASEEANARLPVELAECSPGCPLWAVSNGQCLEACNVEACDFDGGDCSCPDDTCACFPGQATSPEGECCEPEAVGTDLLFSFVMSQFGYDPSQKQSSFLPDSGFLKDRISNFKNRLLVGMFIHQTRASTSSCDHKRFANIDDTCLSTSPSLEPYGVDPVFLETSSMFDPTLNAKDFYPDPSLFTANNVPLGFFHRKIKGYPDGFSVIFDINLSHDQAVARLQYLEDGFFINNGTRSLLVQLVTYNGEQEQFTSVEVECTFQDGGLLAVQSSINAVALELYHSTTDYVRAVLEALLLLVIVHQLVGELREFYRAMLTHRRVLAYFDSAWNYVDLASLALLFICSILWISNYAQQSAGFQVEPRYDVYASLDAEAHFWELGAGGLWFDVAAGKLVHIHHIIQFRSAYMAINGISLFLIMLRVLKYLDFQPRMGIITRSLGAAGPELMSFFLLLAIIFVIYSLQAHLVFGRSIDAYRSFAAAMVTNFELIMGDTTVNGDLLLLQGWELAAGQIFFWTFIVFVTFILMNFLIAIVVDAFVEAKGNSDAASSMPAEVLDMVREEVESVWKRGISDKRLLQQLTAWHVRKKRLDSQKSMGAAKHNESRWGILAAVMDRINAIKQGNVCVRVPKGDAGNGAAGEGHQVEMAELDYQTVLAILKRCKDRAGGDDGDEEDVLPGGKRKKAKKEVVPDIATRSLFMRFGETPTTVKLAVKKVEDKKRVGRDAQMLKGILEKMQGTLDSVNEQLMELRGSHAVLDMRLKAVERGGSSSFSIALPQPASPPAPPGASEIGPNSSARRT